MRGKRRAGSLKEEGTMRLAELLKEHPGEILELFLLVGNSITDLCVRRISLSFSGICALFGLWLCLTDGRNVPAVLGALLPGLLLTAAGFFMKEQVGTGDGLVILISGLFLTLREVLSLCATASLLALIPAGVLFLLGRRKAKIPFVPFLLAGYVLITMVL